MLPVEETVVMDVRPFPAGQGFSGAEEWWDYVLSGDEQARLDSMIGAAMLDDSLCKRLLNGVDATVLAAFGLSEPTINLMRHIHVTTLPEFAQRAISVLKLDNQPT